jgi:hypothetical protein
MHFPTGILPPGQQYAGVTDSEVKTIAGFSNAHVVLSLAIQRLSRCSLGQPRCAGAPLRFAPIKEMGCLSLRAVMRGWRRDEQRPARFALASGGSNKEQWRAS